MMSLKARLICIVIGIVVLFLISFLVRRRRLYNVYAITWFLAGISFLFIGLLPSIVENSASILGIYSTSNAILVIAIGGISAIVLHLSIIVSEQNLKVRQFEKEISLLRKQMPVGNLNEVSDVFSEEKI